MHRRTVTAPLIFLVLSISGCSLIYDFEDSTGSAGGADSGGHAGVGGNMTKGAGAGTKDGTSITASTLGGASSTRGGSGSTSGGTSNGTVTNANGASTSVDTTIVSMTGGTSSVAGAGGVTSFATSGSGGVSAAGSGFTSVGGAATGGIATIIGNGGQTSLATGGAAGRGGAAMGGLNSAGAKAQAGAATGGVATGGAATSGGVTTGGVATGGVATGGTTTTPPAPIRVVTSDGKTNNWMAATFTEVTSGTADATVNDATTLQSWDGFGGYFSEAGWNVLTTLALQTEAANLLFGSEGANFSWGRIPIGASDYALSRYTLDDPATADPLAESSGANRPTGDTSLSKFSLARDEQKLIPFIKAAQAAKATKTDLRFWASPWTPPVWMKTGYKSTDGSGGTAKKASYFDGGNMSSDSANLTAYAQYFTRFVQGYQERGIKIDTVSPQNEPGYEENYPSCLWDKTTYTNFVGQYLGPAMQSLGVKVMLGTLSNPGDNGRADLDIASTVLSDATASGFVSVAGAQWGVLDKVNGGTTFGALPIWATAHKCGNYPWNTSTYNNTQAPNDLAYGVESWGYIRDAITKGKVTAYNAWHMVLDPKGLGIDTSRDWKQNALLVVTGGSIIKTPAYWVFRHVSQFAAPGGKVVTASSSGVDTIAFKNPDGGLVAVVYNPAVAKSTFTVSIGGKKVQFTMPGSAWATVYVPRN